MKQGLKYFIIITIVASIGYIIYILMKDKGTKDKGTTAKATTKKALVTNDDKGTTEEPTDWSMVGGVITGGVVFVLSIVAIIIVFMRRRRSNDQKENDQSGQTQSFLSKDNNNATNKPKDNNNAIDKPLTEKELSIKGENNELIGKTNLNIEFFKKFNEEIELDFSNYIRTHTDVFTLDTLRSLKPKFEEDNERLKNKLIKDLQKKRRALGGFNDELEEKIKELEEVFKKTPEVVITTDLLAKIIEQKQKSTKASEISKIINELESILKREFISVTDDDTEDNKNFVTFIDTARHDYKKIYENNIAILTPKPESLIDIEERYKIKINQINSVVTTI